MCLVRALGAALVLSTLIAPYAQPLFCTVGMNEVSEGMTMPDEHAPHAAANTMTDAATAPCVPLCVLARVAPPATGAPIILTADHAHTGVADAAPTRSATLLISVPPPKA